MLKNLFGGSSPPALTASGERIYAIGDIHGRSDLLDRLLAVIFADEAQAGAGKLIFLGDYVDRGPDSRGVVDRLIEMSSDRPSTIFLKGNHEAALLDFVKDPRNNVDWLHWGGAETLESYGLAKVWSRDADDLAAEMRAALPAAHCKFLQALELTHVSGDYIFVHAGLKPGAPLDAQEERDLLWIRGEFHNMDREARPDKVVVHGHHPIKAPLDAGWRIDVDTGACFTGRLTAVVLDGETRRFLST